MAASTLRTALATTVSAAAGDTTRNFDYLPRFGLRTGGLGSTYGYLYFALSAIPRGAVVSSAKLYLYGATATNQTGSITLTLRRLKQTVSTAKVTYTTRPTALYGDTAATATKTGPLAAGVEWQIDVTAHVQSVANGDPWYGWQITGNANPIYWLAESNWPTSTQRPRLELAWSVPPTAPTSLRPGGGRSISLPRPIVAATYTDVGADNQLAAVQVQTSGTNTWTAPYYDSGVQTATAPELDLSLAQSHTQPVGTTAGSTAITTTGVFEAADVGQSIAGAGIPAGATIASTQNATQATLSAAATATGAGVTATISRLFPAPANGTVVWWRMRCQDVNGLWSPWSAAESWVRNAKGVVAVLNPQPAPNNYVTETTPPISWSLTGEVQTAWQINVADPVTGRIIYTTGKRTGTETGFTLPPSALAGQPVGAAFSLRVIVWDSKQRETISGDPAWTDAGLDFDFRLSDQTPPTTSLVLTSGEPRPRVTLTWQRGTFPDSYSIMRDGVVIASGLNPADLAPGGTGTTFSWVDPAPSPRRPTTYQVLAVVNGKASAGNSTATITLASVGIWLADHGRDNEVVLFGREARSWTYGEESEVLTALGSSESTVVTHSMRGLEGTVTGTIQDGSIIGQPSTAPQYADALLRIRRNAGQQCWLTIHDQTIPVVVRAITCTPRATPTPQYDVSFEFYQVAAR